MTATAEIALGLGLEVWFSPAFFEYQPEETTSRLVRGRPRGIGP